MQKACELAPSSMAAILGLDDEKVEALCAETQQETGEVVSAANYNCPGQVVISGSVNGVARACEKLKAAGAKRALILPVGGAFHSALMEPAKKELQAAIEKTTFYQPSCHIYQNVVACHIYQNVVAKAVFNQQEIKKNLVEQLTGPVRWTQTIQAMINDGAKKFTEVGPGKVLQGLVSKISKEVEVDGVTLPGA